MQTNLHHATQGQLMGTEAHMCLAGISALYYGDIIASYR